MSFLMDRTTLLAHRDLWVQEQEQFDGSLPRLNCLESTLFDELKRGELGDRVRFEQERVSFGWFQNALKILPPIEL